MTVNQLTYHANKEKERANRENERRAREELATQQHWNKWQLQLAYDKFGHEAQTDWFDRIAGKDSPLGWISKGLFA